LGSTFQENLGPYNDGAQAAERLHAALQEQPPLEVR
jgi:hypothetical protein